MSPAINIFDPSLGIQRVMDTPVQEALPTARPLAFSGMREAGLEELYTPTNAQLLIEAALCPHVGDGEMLRPDVFSENLTQCADTLRHAEDPALRDLVREVLDPLLENKALLNAYSGLMIGG